MRCSRTLRAEYPATPLRVISALAEGADRLVADLALQSGCDLIVPLPMPTADYEQDFPQTVGRISRPSGAGARTQRVRAAVAACGPLAADSGAARRALSGGGHLHRRAESLLLALWDGVRNNAIAGTAEVGALQARGASARG